MGQCMITRRGNNPKLSGNATTGDALSGKTFYNTDAKTKLTGTLTLKSLVSSVTKINSNTSTSPATDKVTITTDGIYILCQPYWSDNNTFSISGGTQLYTEQYGHDNGNDHTRFRIGIFKLSKGNVITINKTYMGMWSLYKLNNYAWFSDINIYSICINTICLCEDK